MESMKDKGRVVKRASRWVSVAAGIFAAAACVQASASDGGRLAADQGCLNCHLDHDAAAPSLKRLSVRLSRMGGDAHGIDDMLSEVREHGPIHTHQMVSDDAARAVLRWMAAGAK
jgi:cytochrome c551/c552